MLEFLEKIDSYSEVTLSQFFDCCPYTKCHSNTVPRVDLYSGDAKTTKVTDFFASGRPAELMDVPEGYSSVRYGRVTTSGFTNIDLRLSNKKELDIMYKRSKIGYVRDRIKASKGVGYELLFQCGRTNK